jgi:hypothetical protein
MKEFTTISTVDVIGGQPVCVVVTEYVPALANDAGEIVGFCIAEVKPAGPFQL